MYTLYHGEGGFEAVGGDGDRTNGYLDVTTDVESASVSYAAPKEQYKAFDESADPEYAAPAVTETYGGFGDPEGVYTAL